MDDWVEEHLSALSEDAEQRTGRVLDQKMIHEPIRTLHPPAPISVTTGTSVGAAIELMKERRVGCVLVIDGERLAGIFSERDVLIKVANTGRDVERTAVEELMTPDPEVLRLDDAIVFALNKMSVGGFRHVPLVDEAGRPVGVVSVRMIVDYIVDFFPREVFNLPPEPDKNLAREREGA